MRTNINDLQTYRYCKEIQFRLSRIYFLSNFASVVHYGRQDDLPDELKKFTTEEFLLYGVGALTSGFEQIGRLGKVYSYDNTWKPPRAPYFRGRRICRETEYMLNEIHRMLCVLFGSWPVDELGLVMFADIPLKKRRAFILRYLDRTVSFICYRFSELIPNLSLTDEAI